MLVGLSTGTVAASGAPQNDMFANAINVSSSLPYSSTTVDTTYATTESDEPGYSGCTNYNTPSNTVWYKYVAATSGGIQVNTFGSNFDTVILVYQGTSISGLSQITCAHQSAVFGQFVAFHATAGLTYWIQLCGDPADGATNPYGSLHVNIKTQVPANDFFSDAINVSSSLPYSSTTVDTTYATTESDEPGYSGCTNYNTPSNTVWYKYVAATSGGIQVNTFGSNFDTVILVYQGTSISGLSQITCAHQDGVKDEAVSFSTTAGLTYWIQVGGDPADGATNPYGTFGISVPAPYENLAVTTYTSWTAGASHSVTVKAIDAHGNVDTGYVGRIHFTSTDSKAVLPADYTFTATDKGVHKFTTALTLKTAGSESVTATDTVKKSITGHQTVTVTPAAAKTLGVSASNNPTVAGAAHSVTVKALDAYGNTVTGYAGTVHFTSTDSQALLPANYTFIAGDSGSHKFTGALTLKTAGARSVTVTDTAHSSIRGSQTITVTPGTARTLSVSIAANPFAAGSAHSLTIKALDAYGNVATGYTGTIHFTSSDSAAVLPGDYTFTGTDAGSHKFTNGLTLNTTGSQSVTATDNSHSSITGSQTVTVSGGA